METKEEFKIDVVKAIAHLNFIKDKAYYKGKNEERQKAERDLKQLEREIEDYIDYLGKSNKMWSNSQEDIAYLILNKIREVRKTLGGDL